MATAVNNFRSGVWGEGTDVGEVSGIAKPIFALVYEPEGEKQIGRLAFIRGSSRLDVFYIGDEVFAAQVMVHGMRTRDEWFCYDARLMQRYVELAMAQGGATWFGPRHVPGDAFDEEW